MTTTTLTAGRAGHAGHAGHAVYDFFGRIADMFEILRAASRVAASIESRRAPAVDDLKMLGIDDPDSIAAISARR